MISTKLKSFCSLLAKFFANILHNSSSQDNIVMKIVSFRQIFENFSEPDNFQDIATYFTVGEQQIEEDILISVCCWNISKTIYYVRSRSFLIQLHWLNFFALAFIVLVSYMKMKVTESWKIIWWVWMLSSTAMLISNSVSPES